MIIELTLANKGAPEQTWTETFEKNPNEVDDPQGFAKTLVEEFNDSPWTKERNMAHPDHVPGLWGGFMRAAYRRQYERHEGTRPPNPERILKEVNVRGKDDWPSHDWVKASVMMESGRSGDHFDWYVCKRCHVVGRGGITGDVELEPVYRRSRVYHHCDDAKKHVQKHGHPSGLSKEAERAQKYVRGN